MTRQMMFSSLVLGCLFGVGVVLRGQEPSPLQPAGPRATSARTAPLIPLKVQVTIARYQGDKKVSSLPYMLSVNANDFANGPIEPEKSSLRMGAQVPVPTLVQPNMQNRSPEQRNDPAGPVWYKDIGTNIDCSARSLDDGRFSVVVIIQDTSVYSDGQTAQGAPNLKDIPTFRTFSSNERLILKDGQTAQFTAAADKISGEVTRVDVTVTVVK